MFNTNVFLVILSADSPKLGSTKNNFEDIHYLLYSRVPKCGSETTLALMTNTSMINNISMEVHQNLKYFEHQWFNGDRAEVSFQFDFTTAFWC